MCMLKNVMNTWSTRIKTICLFFYIFYPLHNSCSLKHQITQLNVFTRKMRITENCRVKSKLFFSCLTKLLPLGLKQILQLSTFPCVFVMFVFSPPLCSSMFSFIVSCFHFSLSKCIVVWSSGSKWASFVSFFASMPFLASGSSSETFLCNGRIYNSMYMLLWILEEINLALETFWNYL